MMAWNTIAKSQRLVAEEFKIPLRKMIEPDQARDASIPRQAGYYVAWKASGKPLAAVARKFTRDPTTVSHGIRTTELRMKTDQKFRDRVEKLVAKAVASGPSVGL